MKDQDTHSSSRFLKTDGGKTKSNAIEVPSISLPKGGGAIQGIDEKFSVNAVNGTASFSIPLPFSPARGASPALSLSYSSGSGNGTFGLGWSLGLSSVKRKTEKGLPQYLDAIDSDVFLFSGAEDLVPEYKKGPDGKFILTEQGAYVIHEKEIISGGNFTIRYYRPRMEGLFARIERWTEQNTGIIKWKVTTRDNTSTLFGWTDQAVIADPLDRTRIFEWLPEFIFDDKGNSCRYFYKQENAAGFNDLLPQHRNRLKEGRVTYTNSYLQKILYGNKFSYDGFGTAFPAEETYMFKTIFDYGEYQQQAPYQEKEEWTFRPDAFSDYRAGFEIRTTRLCRRVLLFHCFAGLPGGEALVRSLDLAYSSFTDSDFTFLLSAKSVGYIKQQDGSYTCKALPAMEFEYQQHEWNPTVKSVASEELVHAPIGIEGSSYQFTDLYNEGLSGILTEQATGWYYKQNLGDGKFARAKLVSPKPSFSGLGSALQFADLDADGGRQLVNFGEGANGYFELTDEEEWLPFRSFRSSLNIDLSDANARMLDLNGDGRPELLITEDNAFTWYPSEGRNGFSQARKTAKSTDEEAGPAIVFADPKQTIFLADMSGDGMTDIVRIRNSDICYWPNLGYGKFGAKVTMNNAPLFDQPDAFNPAYIRLADIDGSGTPDVIYLGKNKFSCWMNLSGNGFSADPFEITAFPEIHDRANVTVTDLLGNGVACIVWSSLLAKNTAAPLRYIDLMNSKKPHIMVFYKNNLGKEVSLSYTPSTAFYLEDKAAGRPWATKLHFPVHCISRTETRDRISGYRFVSAYKYHHGYYDHAEREFRGFGMVEQQDSEDVEHWIKGDHSNIVDATLHQAPVLTKSWFHTGAFAGKEKMLTQFESEYWQEEIKRQGFEALHFESPLPDAIVLPARGLDETMIRQMSAAEWLEALRACKGMALRSEIFSLDAPLNAPTEEERKKQLLPYTVATHNCAIELLQPKGNNQHAVFLVKESEAISYQYDRNPADPRISHTINLQTDEYGNVLEAAAIVYSRLADATVPEQSKTMISYTKSSFTNDVISDEVYRTRMPSEVQTYELKGIKKQGSLYTISDLKDIDEADEIAYHETEKEPDDKAQKRLIEHVRSIYYSDNLRDALPLHELASLGFPYESYQLAYTPALLTDIYEDKVNDELLRAGKFVNADGNWWVCSGIVKYLREGEIPADAQKRFYMPLAYADAFGAETTVLYDDDFLFVKETKDELNNTSTVARFNYRTLSPQRMKDLNDNLSEVLTDELGLVKAIAVMGKGTEADDLAGQAEATGEAEKALTGSFFLSGDSTEIDTTGKALLKNATAYFVYDFDAYKNTGRPVVTAAIMREEHHRINAASPVQLSFEYSNGLGQVVMKKVQSEPGPAKQVLVNEDGTYSLNIVDTGEKRWLGNGRAVLNNKGNPVKQYEPYFSASHRYEEVKELVESGVTPIMYYDAVGRLIKTMLPDGTLNRVEFDSWQQRMYDANDTVLESGWYKSRINGLLTGENIDPAKEKAAAEKAAAHANTPNVIHTDTLGRTVVSVEHNKNEGIDEFCTTKAQLDAEGNLRQITDARGNTVMRYKYDMLGNMVFQNSTDAGRRWMLGNVLGNPLCTWDERGHQLQYFYDRLHRPSHSIVKGGEATLDHAFDKMIYGEDAPDAVAHNLRGQVWKHYDTGGLIETPGYDFKGQPLSTSRRLFKKYKEVCYWTEENLSIDLEEQAFVFTTATDALGRITQQTAPDGSVIKPSYNEGGLLTREAVSHVSPAVTNTYIKSISYNEKGQRCKIIYGNDVTTRFYYDALTFRLRRLESKRKNNELLQDLYYTYDPVGNITAIEDKAIPVSFFANARMEPLSGYTYDALYRLKEASGRENTAALSYVQDNWNDAAYMQQINPGDTMAVRNYTQKYGYDAVGNIKSMQHIAGANRWTRQYEYEDSNNRLRSTQVGQALFQYEHHAQHGYITKMPHLAAMSWNFKEELVSTKRQSISNEEAGETTYYQYDGSGQRIRKITENDQRKKNERIYIAGYELYKDYSEAETLERSTLSLMDEGHRFAMIETRNEVDDGSEQFMIRYQLHNHLGSASLELNETAQLISYEEYHPFGTTAYQAKNKTIKATAKRYRYTGMERDEETGLEYHSARYYLPWLGRWLSADPIGVKGGINLYGYCGGNPISFVDLSGKESEDPCKLIPLEFRVRGKASQTESNTTTTERKNNKIEHTNKGWKEDSSKGMSLELRGGFKCEVVKAEGKIKVTDDITLGGSVAAITSQGDIGFTAAKDGFKAKAGAEISIVKLGSSVTAGSVKVGAEVRLGLSAAADIEIGKRLKIKVSFAFGIGGSVNLDINFGKIIGVFHTVTPTVAKSPQIPVVEELSYRYQIVAHDSPNPVPKKIHKHHHHKAKIKYSEAFKQLGYPNLRAA